jgi:hypothetical protein
METIDIVVSRHSWMLLIFIVETLICQGVFLGKVIIHSTLKSSFSLLLRSNYDQ